MEKSPSQTIHTFFLLSNNFVSFYPQLKSKSTLLQLLLLSYAFASAATTNTFKGVVVTKFEIVKLEIFSGGIV